MLGENIVKRIKKDKHEKENSELLTQKENWEIEIPSAKKSKEDTYDEENESAEDRSTPEEFSQELVNKRTSSISKLLLDINKVSQKAFNTDVNIAFYQDTPIKIAMERKGSVREINTLVAINFDASGMTEKGLTIRGTEKLNQFDRIVLDAVNSLFIEGHNQYITTQMIFHVITGDTDRRITPNYAQEINNSLTKLLSTHIVIKANEEAIMYPIWGLQLQVINDDIFDKEAKLKQKREKVKAAKRATPRDIEFVCLKNRYGESNYTCNFKYYAQFDYFVPVEAPRNDFDYNARL